MKTSVVRNSSGLATPAILKSKRIALVSATAWLILHAKDIAPKFIEALVVNVISSGTLSYFM